MIMRILDRLLSEGSDRLLGLIAKTSAILVPLLFGAILWMHHADTREGKGADFAYDDRMVLWSWISHWSKQGGPILAVPPIAPESKEKSGVLQPIEAVYTDDMGFPLLVDLASRATGKALGRREFFDIALGLNVLLLYALMASLWRFPRALFLASVLVLFPKFYIPKEIIGPDLFSLYGTLSLMILATGMLVFHGKTPVAWIGAGMLLTAIYLLRQAVGMILIFTLGAGAFLWILERGHRTFSQSKRLLYALAGALAVWIGFHGMLSWRDHSLGIKAGGNSGAKHHTLFHALYLGIGNMEGNPWGIVYSDKFAYDKILGGDHIKPAQPYSEKYLRGVRRHYLDLWKKDGWRLFRWYGRHFLLVIKTTLGYGTFLLGMGYFVFGVVSRFRSAVPSSAWETAFVCLALGILGFLAQSTLIDHHHLFSYPTGLLGRYLLGFGAADALRRILKTRAREIKR